MNMEKQTLVIIGLVVALATVSFLHVDLTEKHDVLELNYGYAMEMAKMNLSSHNYAEEVKEKIFESKKVNILI